MTKSTQNLAWHDYQERAAALFRRMGFDAIVDDTLQGARGTHNVDVVARMKVRGIPMIWIVECKYWKATVPKAQVLTLIQIAQDVGADRAFLLSESGFQAGAIAAVSKTNVSLTNIDELEEIASDSIAEISIKRSLTEAKTLEHNLQGLLEKHGLSTPIPPLLDAIITLLGACLEVTMAATAALTSRFPVHLPTMLSHPSTTSTSVLSEVAEALDHAVRQIAEKSAALEASQLKAISVALDYAEELNFRVRELLQRSDALLIGAPNQDAEQAKLCRALDAMRSVGRQAEMLHDVPDAELACAVRALMRQLIDGVYLWIGDPARTPEKWIVTKTATDEAVNVLSRVIGNLRQKSD